MHQKKMPHPTRLHRIKLTKPRIVRRRPEISLPRQSKTKLMMGLPPAKLLLEHGNTSTPWSGNMALKSSKHTMPPKRMQHAAKASQLSSHRVTGHSNKSFPRCRQTSHQSCRTVCRPSLTLGPWLRSRSIWTVQANRFQRWECFSLRINTLDMMWGRKVQSNCPSYRQLSKQLNTYL